ncbi:MAG: peptidylprolyl isomerase [Planctomycetes bacterium]|nr:peptidylprolyl isomerase [Planctomycetota bacterium]
MIGTQGQDGTTTAGNGPTLTEPVQLRADPASTNTPALPVADTRSFPEVLIKTTLGEIRLRLNAEKAPVTVDNFLQNYVDQGFYNNTVFHYVDEGHIIAAGGYTSDLQQKQPRESIPNEADNGLKNVRGTIAMSRDRDDAETANCQFFINLADNAGLDHKGQDSADDFGYCVFGEVIEGMDVADRIGNSEVTDQANFASTPSQKAEIISAERSS